MSDSIIPARPGAGVTKDMADQAAAEGRELGEHLLKQTIESGKGDDTRINLNMHKLTVACGYILATKFADEVVYGHAKLDERLEDFMKNVRSTCKLQIKYLKEQEAALQRRDKMGKGKFKDDGKH